MFLEVSPAYGREYSNAKAVKADWDAEKDFLIQTMGPDEGRYVNKKDAPKGTVMIRYARMTKVTSVKVK